MLRYRRYRVFLAFAVISLFALYKFGTSNTSWRDISTSSGSLKSGSEPVDAGLSRAPISEVALETKKLSIDIPAAKTPPARHTPPPITPVSRPVDKPPPAASITPAAKPAAIGAGGPKVQSPLSTADDDSVVGAASDVEEFTSTEEAIHWSRPTENYPVPSESLAKLPTGAAKPIPKIQFAFEKESEVAKADRVEKLTKIKDVFKRSWDGYKRFAWLHDELKPLSGTSRDPFAGWGATLVDALDTLWIMGMKEDFEEAVKAVDKIDFTTTTRMDIPLFETTIRYLGGLLAAYDLSDRKHKNLLEKAVELAEILMSAFDTPNRMPETYYYWRPGYSINPHRASNRIVMAEIGSLSVEFTRLAQVTGEHKYYDAIARITDNFEEYQNKTRLPGMWPTYLDASGCKRIDYSLVSTPDQAPINPKLAPFLSEDATPTVELSPQGNKFTPLDLPPPIVFHAESPTPSAILSPQGNKYKALDLPPPIVFHAEKPTANPNPPALVPGEPGKAKIKSWDDETVIGDLNKDAARVQKRQLELPEATEEPASPTTSGALASASPECEEQGFAGSSGYGNEEYTLGGMSDSTYEYLPKEWLLLGGRVDKYRTMYEQSIEVVKDNLLFRPMLPKEDDILFSGKLLVGTHKPKKGNGELEAENAHLTCFAGGMFGMGAKIFDRPQDLEIAKKLTEGCVYSYGMTNSGIMPESFISVPCESMKECPWNATKYWLAIDPGADARVEVYKQQMNTYQQQLVSASALFDAEMAAFTGAPKTAAIAPNSVPTPATPLRGTTVQKRWLDVEDMEPETVPKHQIPQRAPLPPRPQPNLIMVEGEAEEAEGPPTPVQADPIGSEEPTASVPVFPVIYSPRPPLTHEEYVQNRIQEERLPEGVTTIRAKNYILRPEAIESVWYMYRITGDKHWREVGWTMFEAVNSHTYTKYGNSAIDDVTKVKPERNDEMESFWLAETLKYFYLLFADENVVNLDEWVLNTEAHPFRRPT